MINKNWEVKVVDRFGLWQVDIYLIEKGYKNVGKYPLIAGIWL